MPKQTIMLKCLIIRVIRRGDTNNDNDKALKDSGQIDSKFNPWTTTRGAVHLLLSESRHKDLHKVVESLFNQPDDIA